MPRLIDTRLRINWNKETKKKKTNQKTGKKEVERGNGIIVVPVSFVIDKTRAIMEIDICRNLSTLRSLPRYHAPRLYNI